MVLSFALCASFAFAQTNISESAKTTDNAVRVESQDAQLSVAGYNGSIFTKDAPIFECDFSQGSAYTTGTITSQTVIDGITFPGHTNSAYYAQWRRWNSLDSAYLMSQATNYPASISRFIGLIRSFGNADSASQDNGFMYMSMIDNYAPWGGVDASGEQDAYIKFDNINTTGHNLVVARFLQIYRCFNWDQCYVDYSNNGGEIWHTLEINVKGIDVLTNNNIFQWKRVTLPNLVGNCANVSLRLRYVDMSTDQNGGYMWMVDDFKIIDAPDNHLTVKQYQYFEGFYQMMPQGLQLPVVWNAQIVNDGGTAQTNVNGSVYAFSDDNTTATLVAGRTLANIPSDPLTTRSIVLDPLGYYDSLADSRASDLWIGYHGSSYYDGAWCTPASTKGYLPTATPGIYHFYSDITSDYYTNHIFDTATFDTIRYEVNWYSTTDGAEHEHGVWARDHGVIRDSSSWTYGMVGASTFSEVGNNWDKADYGVMVGYTTGDVVPENMYIIGVELVPATRLDMNGYVNGEAARIRPLLMSTSLTEDGSGRRHTQYNLGTSSHLIQPSETHSATFLNSLSYKEYGEYNTIKIWFNNQIPLEAHMPYFVGYELAEEGKFACASSGNTFNMPGQGGSIWFGETEGMESLGSILTVANPHSVSVIDGNIHNFNINTYPMIRMLIGPKFDVPQTVVQLDCAQEEYGFFTFDGTTSICGELDTVPVGGAATYYAFPTTGYKIDKIYKDGVPLVLDIDYDTAFDEESAVYYAIITLENISANGHTLNCTFKEDVGFDPVASDVVMRLQPNPATSNVYVSLKGMSGMVNMSVIDMSGRVVTSSQFNAENGANINVSNLAKGAYFVRITNDKCSKVEKLIVR